jgi:SWI/SNF-related matrix-associated actin-dependent regulator of chromatin subfamily A-like protein 1
MGVGKTWPAIETAFGRTIILCPASVKQNWRNEISRQKPGARILLLSGTYAGPIDDNGDYVILNYDIADAWREYLVAWRPNTCIADEAHVCRNRRTTRFQATLQIIWACYWRRLLTGTPIVNQPLDLVALINMLGKLNSVFGGWKAFVDRYCGAQQTQWCYDTSGASNLNELHEILYREKNMLRRMKREVLTLSKDQDHFPHHRRSGGPS